MENPSQSNGGESCSSSVGNVMIMGVLLASLLAMFGSVMLSRMIVDADISARKISGSKAFYLADSGIQLGRRYLVFSNSNTSFGPLDIGAGSLTVEIERTTAYYPNADDEENVYRITSTATVGNTTRQVMELRYRGGGDDKDFMLWRENVADES